MKNFRLVAVAILLLAQSQAASALINDNGQSMILGLGINSCGSWTENKRTDNLSNYTERQWLLGYVTAFNTWGPGDENISSGIDNNGLLAWVDNYCAANPLQTIGNAAEALVVTLYKNNHPKKSK